MTRIEELIAELEHEATATRRALERVPGDRLDWRPHEKSMSLGQLAMHVATIPGRIAEIAMESSFDAGRPVERPSAASRAELLEAFASSLARAESLISSLGDEDLVTTWKMSSGGKEIASMPRGGVLRYVLLNHWVHHRGQLAVYLRMTGAAVPAIYGDSADERPI